MKSFSFKGWHPPTLHSLIPLPRSCSSTCLACFQDSSHCFIVPLASSSSCRSRASSAAPGPDRNAGEVLGEKLPEAKCSHMLLFIPFKPVSQGNREGYVTGAGNFPISSLPLWNPGFKNMYIEKKKDHLKNYFHPQDPGVHQRGTL